MFSRFARKLGLHSVANRSDFAVIPVQGFNPGKVLDFTHGIETTLGTKVITSAVFDRDYRSADECRSEIAMLRTVCRLAHIHSRKELENFLLAPQPLRRAVAQRVTERNRRAGTATCFDEDMGELLSSLTESTRHRVEARYLARRRQFERSCRNGRDDSTIDEQLLAEFDAVWTHAEKRLLIVPGKETLSALNAYLQERYGVTVSISLIVESFRRDEVPDEMKELLNSFDEFRQMAVDESVQQG